MAIPYFTSLFLVFLLFSRMSDRPKLLLRLAVPPPLLGSSSFGSVDAFPRGPTGVEGKASFVLRAEEDLNSPSIKSVSFLLWCGGGWTLLLSVQWTG